MLGCQKTAFKPAYAASMNQRVSRPVALATPQDQASLQHAWRLLQAGDIAQATALFSGLSTRAPCRLEACMGLANAALAQGNPSQAVSWAEHVVADPLAPLSAHVFLCRVWRQMGQSRCAADHCQRVLQIHPTALELWVVRALALKECGLLDEAEQACRHALLLAPGDAMVNQNLGNLLQAKGDLSAARDCYVQVLASSPGHVPACFELAQVARKMGAVDQARELYRQVLTARPDLLQAWRAKADLELQAGQPSLACEALLALTQLQPADPKPWFEMAQFKALSQPEEAIVMAERGLQLAPNEARGHYLVALSRRALHQAQASLLASQRAHALSEDPVLKAECLYLQAVALLDMGQLEAAADSAARLQDLAADDHQKAIACDVQAGIAMLMCDVGRALELYRLSIAQSPGRFQPHAALSAALLYDDASSLQAQRDQTRRLMAAIDPFRGNAYFANDRQGLRPLKLGYLSGDLRQHSCASFITPLWQAHDRQQVHVTAYHTHAGGDAVTDKLRALCDQWRDVAAMSDQALRQQILADEIDVLIDLSGFTDGGRPQVLALGAAPVQVAWLGYLGTSGLRAVQHRLTDGWVNPPELDHGLTELAVRLPRTYLCFQPDPMAPAISPLPMWKAGHPTFGSFNVLHKISPTCVRLWAAVLHAVPDARLLLKTRVLDEPVARERLWSQFEEAGIERERIECLGWIEGQAHHLDLYGRVDVALDTWPYNGVTTTCEALWMGVPVVSLLGEPAVSRQGLTLLTSVGMPELCVTTEAAYARVCAQLVSDPQALANRRASLRALMAQSSLLDAQGFARSFESAVRSCWQTWAQGRQVG